MRTLILGHGKLYKKKDIRCSPIPVDDWFNEPYESLDYDPYVDPDILFEIKTGVWTFAPDETYDRIIDTTGGVLSYGGSHYSIRRSFPHVLREVQRILKPSGIFYTDLRNDTVYQKQGEQLIKIPKRLKKDTQNYFE